MKIKYLQELIFLQNFYFSQEADVQYERELLESDPKINSVLFAVKLIVSIILLYKDLLYYEDFFLEEHKWEKDDFGNYENFHG